MGKVNYNTYTPESDSTAGLLRRTDIKVPKGAIVLARKGDTGCPCGCFEVPTGKKRSFLMGHDARFKGKLIRAHISGADVTHVILEEKGSIKSGAVRKIETNTAMELATRHGWEHVLEAAAERAAAPAPSKPRKAAASNGKVKVGDEVKGVKIGRWTRDGIVVGVSKKGTEIEYQDAKGNTKRHLIPA